MKIRSPLAQKESRLEIIPLIDIMFFLLASFMMVSLQLQKVRTLKAALPTATIASTTSKPALIKLFVDAAGQVSIDYHPLSLAELQKVLAQRLAADTNVPVYITGSREATHGSMVYVLDFVKRAGVQRVAFSVKAESVRP